MPHSVSHVIGNGPSSSMFNHRVKGTRIVCNIPPFEIENVYSAVIVDFKMMSALTEGSLNLDAFPWVLGTRPKIWMEQNPSFYMQKSQNIRMFYTIVPKYAENATNFNCGHCATHYTANHLKAKEIHMYGFDSIFDHNMTSVSDFLLSSDRSQTNNYRLLNTWRPIWTHMFNEFPDTKFVLHHGHNNSKIKLPDNVEVFTSKKK